MTTTAVLSFDVDAESAILAVGRRYADHAMAMTHQAFGPGTAESRSDNSVEPTMSENSTVMCLRSAGDVDAPGSPTDDCCGVQSSATAANRRRRWPTVTTPNSLRSSAVS